ncbi:YjjG family noncanonical pyrimidine nucleotidase [Gottschalkiaceae bacterium SANA]|nr:YjjG family noncanonical pyrimidine nucleotidase [Gottschalkiaceae bacterium SANA]
MKYEVVFLDADGTVWDFKRSEEKAFLSTLKSYGVEENLEGVYRRYSRINELLWERLEQGTIKKDELRRKRFEDLFAEFQFKIPIDEFSREYLAAIAQGKDLIDGAEDICRYLSERYRVVVVTNGMKETQNSRMAGSTLEPFIEKMIISDEISIAKPEPGIFEYAMNAIGYKDKERVIMIGDSLSADIAGGVNFGIDTCWINPSKLVAGNNIVPTYEIMDIRELKNIL